MEGPRGDAARAFVFPGESPVKDKGLTQSSQRTRRSQRRGEEGFPRPEGLSYRSE